MAQKNRGAVKQTVKEGFVLVYTNSLVRASQWVNIKKNIKSMENVLIVLLNLIKWVNF
jgi:hypothetical protein